MKMILCTLLLCISALAVGAQDFHGEYYNAQRAMQESVAMQQRAVVMLGNSITERGRWSEFFPEVVIYNRGIGGDIIAGMQDRLGLIVASRPSKIFIMAGINDLLFFDISVDDFRMQMRMLIKTIREGSPGTRIYLQSLLPVNDAVALEGSEKYFTGKNPRIEDLNNVLKLLAEELHTTYIDIYPHMLAIDTLDPAFTVDGIHLSPAGYKVWVEILMPFLLPKSADIKVTGKFEAQKSVDRSCVH